jgi:hypothetical protein
MKKISLLHLIVSALLLMALYGRCQKEPTPAPADGLPPETQEGKNTLACTINGRPYILCAEWPDSDPFLGSGSPLHMESILYDSSVYIYMRTRDKCSTDGVQYETIDISFRYRFEDSGFDWRHILYNDYSEWEQYCQGEEDFKNYDTLSPINAVTITKMDVANRIVAGRFQFDLYMPGCTDTVHIRGGRFDMKF